MSNSDTSSGSAQPGLQLLVDVTTLPKKGFPVDHVASQIERKALVGLYELASVSSFQIKARIFRWRARGARVEGEVIAALEQICVVSGQNVPSEIVEPFEVLYLPEGSKLTTPDTMKEGELVLDVMAEDPPEIFSGREIDVGAIAGEFFSLALEPFPRADGVFLDELNEEQIDSDADKPPSPFAALKGLKLD